MVSLSLRKNIKNYLKRIPYRKIILFGSRAGINYTDQSDFDLLIILSKTMTIHEKRHISTLLRKRFASKMIDADVIVKDEEDIEYLKDKPGSIVRNALREGICI